jgi:hypothetical protein
MSGKTCLVGLSAAALSLVPGAALAGHGKAGLWNITTSIGGMPSVQLPPEAMARMKAMGMKMPSGGQSFSSQICMTQAEVDSDKLPPVGKNDMGCTSHVTSQTANSMSAETVCTGDMKGTGRMQISYSGAEHYSGSYSFKGMIHDRSMETNSTFKGDWIKADCGAVKPFVPKK